MLHSSVGAGVGFGWGNGVGAVECPPPPHAIVLTVATRARDVRRSMVDGPPARLYRQGRNGPKASEASEYQIGSTASCGRSACPLSRVDTIRAVRAAHPRSYRRSPGPGVQAEGSDPGQLGRTG